MNHQANPFDYFNWYLRHSDKFIANAEHVIQHGYQPIAGRYEALAMRHERLYRMNQTIENDNTQSSQVRDIARQMTSYSRDAMNAAHLNTRKLWFVRQRQFQNPPFHAGRLSFSTDINNPRITTRPHIPTTCGTGRHKQQQQPHQDRR
ncbi:hypothetical protein KY284_033504 [Solanum tuberosum]|nr:hypothetical protein KY284_033504 [Solanum tuberosum]